MKYQYFFCRCKFGQLGPGKTQFNSPHGFCLGLDEDIIVADTNNHRIQVFDKGGETKWQFGIPGLLFITILPIAENFLISQGNEVYAYPCTLAKLQFINAYLSKIEISKCVLQLRNAAMYK